LESLIAMLAHYAALDRLLHEGLCRGDEPDLGWQADLACVFLGMGIFGANSAIKQRSGGDGIWTWWQIRARHQLPARVFGYAMALAAVARGERQARWVSWLGDDAMDTFQRGLRFLQRRGECIFDFEAHGTLPGCEKNGTGTSRLLIFQGFRRFPLGARPIFSQPLRVAGSALFTRQSGKARIVTCRWAKRVHESRRKAELEAKHRDRFPSVAVRPGENRLRWLGMLDQRKQRAYDLHMHPRLP
jgi:hypothetical protein